jgi:hypothetical protein
MNWGGLKIGNQLFGWKISVKGPKGRQLIEMKIWDETIAWNIELSIISFRKSAGIFLFGEQRYLGEGR